jgi:pimeloyl-ACP methyl ester carboxylesterase
LSGWRDANFYEDDGLRRDLIYVPSGDVEVFASVYAGGRSFGVLICPAWGYEAITYRDCQHRLAIAAARRGGVGVAFDYPGQGDSEGDATTATLDALVRSAVDTAARTRSRFEGEWIVAGIRMGASIAALASASIGASGVFLMEPELDPQAHLRDALRRSRRASLNDPDAEGLAFGIPVSDPLVESTCDAAAAVHDALAETQSPVGAVQFSGAEPVVGYRVTTVEATLEQRTYGQAPLVDAALAWLGERTAAV